MPSQTVCCGRRKIGNVLAGPHQTVRMLLPLQAIATKQVDVLLMVHLVWTDDRRSSLPISPTDKPRPAARVRLYTSDSLSCSGDDEQKQRLDETRSIGTRRGAYPYPTTYKTTSFWLPVKGPHLFVQNASTFDEVRVAISALAFSSRPDESLEEEPIYEEINTPLGSDFLSSLLSTPLHGSTCTISSTGSSSLGYYSGEETLV